MARDSAQPEAVPPIGEPVGTPVAVGPDGLARCPWAGPAADYLAYHDNEWGRPVHGDVAMFQRLTLEAFQSGLSWLTILRRREGFRAAFAEWNPQTVAGFGEADVERLMADTAIIRNRAKIAATITNAKALIRLWDEQGDGALDRLIWSFGSTGDRPRAALLEEVPAQTPQSVALAKALKAKGFVFVGPTTAYAAMQAMGVVDDHLAGCHCVEW